MLRKNLTPVFTHASQSCMGGNKKADCKAVPHSGDKSQEGWQCYQALVLPTCWKRLLLSTHTQSKAVVGITLKELSCMYAFVEGILEQMAWINKFHVPHWPLWSRCFTHIPNSSCYSETLTALLSPCRSQGLKARLIQAHQFTSCHFAIQLSNGSYPRRVAKRASREAPG